MSPAGVLFATFAVLMLLGSPITVALGVAAMAALYTVDQNLVTLVQIAFTSVNSFPIMALPAFMLVGALMECAGISRRLVAIAENIVGPIPGGLAVSTALACVFFGAISGSGPATTAAVGMLMIPAMIRRGFSKGYAAAAAATAGGVGIIIPPSIPMVVYAVSGQQSITKMFLAGVMPGIMIAVGLAAMHLFLCRNMPVAEDLQSGSGDSLLKALKDGLWSLMAPVVILGGIYGGFFTPTEAAVVAIFYSIFVGLFIHRELTFGGIRHSLQITSWMTGRVLIIMFTAYAFERLLVQYRIPDMIVEHILGFTSDVAVIWMFVIALLLFLGMFMETLAIIAYKQPVTKADIEKIRGVKSDHAVNRLVEYDLVYEAGRLDAPGRPALFATTEEFLRRFGVGSTEQLPEMNVEQREEIRSEVEEELNLKIDEEGHLIDEPEKDAGTAEEPVDSETGMEKTEENESGAIISNTEIEKEIESEDNSETDEEDSIS